MDQQQTIDHRIQRYIIGVLIHQKYARFRDLRPPKTDTNLFSYHLKVLLKSGLIAKRSDGYTLSGAGLAYVDRVSIKKMNVRSQPKIITMLMLTNESGEVMLQRRSKQPYIDTWTLPYGKTHIDDVSIKDSAIRELYEKVGLSEIELVHAGDAYIRVFSGDNEDSHDDTAPISTTLAHIFTAQATIQASDTIRWVALDALDQLPLAPAVAQIVRQVKAGGRFFAEFTDFIS